MIIPDIIQWAARNLRKNMTKAEIELWSHIKDKQIWVRFMRQKPIFVYTEDNGHNRFVIADFYCSGKNLIIELDGSIHDIMEVLLLDKEKEELLKHKWLRVIRFQNKEIFNDINKVLQRIQTHV